MPVADKAPHRIPLPRLYADDRQPRQKLAAHRERDDVRVEMPERNAPFLRDDAERVVLVLEEHCEILRLDEKPVVDHRRRVRPAQLRQARDRSLDRGRDLGMPARVEILDPKQAQIRRKQLLLHRKQRGQLDSARVQLDLDNRLPDHLELDEPEISDGEGNGIVIGVGVAQRSEELRCTGQYPLTFGTDQNCEMLHDSPPAACRESHPANERHSRVY